VRTHHGLSWDGPMFWLTYPVTIAVLATSCSDGLQDVLVL